MRRKNTCMICIQDKTIVSFDCTIDAVRFLGGKWKVRYMMVAEQPEVMYEV